MRAAPTGLLKSKAPLGDQGELSLKATEGIRTFRFAERHPVVQQNLQLLIPSVTASPRHLPLVTKGRLWRVPFRIGTFISARSHRRTGQKSTVRAYVRKIIIQTLKK